MNSDTGLIAWGVLLLLVAVPRGATAQESLQELPTAEEVRSAYRSLAYQRARTFAHRALARFHEYDRADLVEIHRVLALVEISQNRRSEARLQFEAALSLDPELELDPAFVSPQILSFFDRVKREWWTRSVAGRTDSSTVEYRIMPDRRVEAVLRSLALPGWGHFYVDRPVRGTVIGAGWSVAIGGALAADGPWRGRLLAAAGGVWLFGYLDLLLGAGSEAASSDVIPSPRSLDRGSFRVGAGLRSVSLQWRF